MIPCGMELASLGRCAHARLSAHALLSRVEYALTHANTAVIDDRDVFKRVVGMGKSGTAGVDDHDASATDGPAVHGRPEPRATRDHAPGARTGRGAGSEYQAGA